MAGVVKFEQAEFAWEGLPHDEVPLREKGTPLGKLYKHWCDSGDFSEEHTPFAEEGFFLPYIPHYVPAEVLTDAEMSLHQRLTFENIAPLKPSIAMALGDNPMMISQMRAFADLARQVRKALYERLEFNIAGFDHLFYRLALPAVDDRDIVGAVDLVIRRDSQLKIVK